MSEHSADRSRTVLLLMGAAVAVVIVLSQFVGFVPIDEGFWVSSFDLLFDHHTFTDNFLWGSYLSLLAGGAWYHLYEELGIWWLRFGNLMLTAGSCWLIFIILGRISTGYARAFGTMLFALLLGLWGTSFISYQGVTVFLYLATIAVLTAERTAPPSIAFWAGALTALNIFARLPNVVSVVLVVMLVYRARVYGFPNRRLLADLAQYVGGMAVATLAMAGLMAAIGHLEFYLDAVYRYVINPETRHESHPLDLIVFRYVENKARQTIAGVACVALAVAALWAGNRTAARRVRWVLLAAGVAASATILGVFLLLQPANTYLGISFHLGQSVAGWEYAATAAYVGCSLLFVALGVARAWHERQHEDAERGYLASVLLFFPVVLVMFGAAGRSLTGQVNVLTGISMVAAIFYMVRRGKDLTSEPPVVLAAFLACVVMPFGTDAPEATSGWGATILAPVVVAALLSGRIRLFENVPLVPGVAKPARAVAVSAAFGVVLLAYVFNGGLLRRPPWAVFSDPVTVNDSRADWIVTDRETSALLNSLISAADEYVEPGDPVLSTAPSIGLVYFLDGLPYLFTSRQIWFAGPERMEKAHSYWEGRIPSVAVIRYRNLDRGEDRRMMDFVMSHGYRMVWDTLDYGVFVPEARLDSTARSTSQPTD